MINNENLDKEFIELFKDNKQKEYFRNLYFYKEDGFLTLVEAGSKKDKYYMNDRDFLDYVKSVIENRRYGDDLTSYASLLEKRGEYSNATLYSSSRMAIELSSKDEFIDKLSKYINIKYSYRKIYLEYPLSYKVNDKTSSTAHMDIVVEYYNSNNKLLAILAIECKMKEIYEIHKYIFTKSYKDKLINLLGNSNVKENDKDIEITFEGKKEGRLEVKQQFCHRFGLEAFKEKHNNVKIYFANLIFDPRNLIDCPKEIKEAYETAIGENKSIEKIFIGTGITYLGIFNQDGEITAV